MTQLTYEEIYAIDKSVCGERDGLVPFVRAIEAKLLAAPIDMVLHCPACGEQHIDKADKPYHELTGPAWENPPHRSHLCHYCNHIWRPADVPTNGVKVVKTRGNADSPVATACRVAAAVPEDFYSHKNSWRDAIGIALDQALLENISYWEHELRAFDRAYAELAAVPKPAQGALR